MSLFSLKVNAPNLAPHSADVRGGLRAWLSLQRRHRARQRSMAALGAIDDHILNDIGLRRSQIEWNLADGVPIRLPQPKRTFPNEVKITPGGIDLGRFSRPMR